MSRLFPTGIDLAKKEIKNAAAQNLASAPSSPSVGQFYLDTTLSPPRLRMWNGVDWLIRADDSDLLGGVNLASVRSFNLSTGQRTALSAISDFDTAVRLSRLDQMAAPNIDLSMASHKITNVTNGTNPQDATTLSQLQAVQQGIAAKQEVRAASPTAGGNITVTYNNVGGASGKGQITAAPNALDGVTLAANDRILLKDQTVGAQDGIWIVTTVGTGANGVWDRATDWDADADVVQGAFVFVQEGTVNADSGWQLTTNNPITVGGASGTALTFAQFSGAGQITAGAALSKSGNVLDVNAGLGISLSTPTADAVNIDTTITARWKSFLLAGALSSYPLTHNLNNQWPVVTVWRVGSPFDEIDPDIFATDANTVTIDFAGVAQVTNTWRATVVG